MKPDISSKKEKRYQRVLEQLESLLTKTEHPIPRMATIAAILHHKMDHFFWTGFYLLIDGELIVGPYQGAVACQILKKNSGVCWSSIQKKEVEIVPDVHQFPGHIACDSRSNSEIVVPLLDQSGSIVGCLDVDSQVYNNFDSIDQIYLTKISHLVYQYKNNPS
ncbi:MAG: GAF domain-containing protein [Bacteroidales bacterium]|jgi:GAF domain-containing protein|nr:GAF domain-containing protein [Bacteroidales bacterium]